MVLGRILLSRRASIQRVHRQRHQRLPQVSQRSPSTPGRDARNPGIDSRPDPVQARANDSETSLELRTKSHLDTLAVSGAANHGSLVRILVNVASEGEGHGGLDVRAVDGLLLAVQERNSGADEESCL